MNIYVLFSLLLFLAPGGCPIYSIDVSTLEVPTDFQNELTLQSMLSSEMHQYRNRLNSNAKLNELTAAQHFEQAHPQVEDNPFDHSDLMRSIEDRIKATYYAAASPDELDAHIEQQQEPQSSQKCSRSASDEDTFLGTNLFGSYPKKCFSAEDIALMSARRDFEMLVPKSYPQCLLHDGIVYTLMKYFNSVNQLVKRMTDTDSRRLLQSAFYDALGGYLRFYLLPVAQVSYYAGRLKLCTVERLVTLYRQCRQMLNTNGNGWKIPVADVLCQLKTVHIKPIRLNGEQGNENDASSCALLDQSCVNEDAQREQMLVPLPHLEAEDSDGYLSNIFLPFKHRRIYNLRSAEAAFILVKFYRTLSNCYRFQGISPKTYNQKLRNWIRENLQVHYRDEMFYPGLGGVLQVYEVLGYSAKSSEQSEENEEPVLSEDDSKDYQLATDDENCNARKTDKKDKEAASRKQSRSAAHDVPVEGAGQKTPKELNNEEECMECDDESYIGYIAAFLALLLLLLILIICCCLQKRKKGIAQTVITKNTHSKPKERVVEKSSDKNIPDVEAPQSPNPEEHHSCWKTLFRSRKKQRRKERKVRETVPTEIKTEPNPGMGIIGSQMNVYRMKLTNLEKYLPRKKASTTEPYYELGSMTSTSSLGYQFQRKFIPLHMQREKRDTYYTKSERKRSKPLAKQTSREHRPQKDQNMEQRESYPAKEDDGIRQIYSHGSKFKRQEGGLHRIEKDGSEDESKSKFCDHSTMKTLSSSPDRKKESGDRQKSQSSAPQLSREVILNQDSQPISEETASMPCSSTAGSSAGRESNAPSWETTFDEDSK
ncbi:uncharacterized protein LOC132784760 [Drosophila nasuta]|uniref:uncharacterized protein LOC132784760 n=1 Tax=Drosophila nasuta TaxID=42062 RepID=UPI00295E7BE1|nr:uncharacterized protein LOC132784760 [Drosophila nasuta]